MSAKILFVIASACSLALVGCERESVANGEEDSPPPAAGDPYANNKASIDVWLERLEVGSRELYSARVQVADAVDLPAGARVADIGAGTGIYSLLFAERVGTEGVVYAVDIEPRFLKLINQRAEDLGLDNVVSVLGREDSITLPPASVDVVFISDTYHYFDAPEAIMRTVFEALRPGGSLYVVDYDLKEGEMPPADKRHVRAGREGVAAEIEAIGFQKAEHVSVPGLSENYMLRFRRP
ncbi:class I SAM-dependent methyltransferase [Amphiplicatus metriothermophilus]|uniref:Methyltransferase domain-containing protein n=1 Tax=Amphiplicatus metriothermophilus TaxID=1519374 RepID=A0A239PP23_9PROT|nr:class I SAM-dependent methyltransferase [Amphiplicatus metriothermophilus]MBB5518786.1 SAM-dependent methyltransferase [Amphiplicatus metriothermophilus]SNT72059.1 Methyltransferase domain-containing protein [Amphiplicatus metriothermophilus]